MIINFNKFKNDCFKNHKHNKGEDELVLFKYIVLYLIRDVFKLDDLIEISDMLNESIQNKK